MPGSYRGVNRYYDPSTDQFLSVDPDVAETGQAYAYTDDDPLNATDPMGLRGWYCIGGATHFYQGNKYGLYGNGPCHAYHNNPLLFFYHEAVEPIYHYAVLPIAHKAATQVGGIASSHAVEGVSGCVVLCVGASLEGGQPSFSFGSIGLGFFTPYIGRATLGACQRHSTDVKVGGGFGLTGTIEYGAASQVTSSGALPIYTNDKEWDVGTGAGVEFGSSHSWSPFC